MAWNNDAPLTEGEADEIRRAAAKHGLSVTKYLMMKAANTDLVQSIVHDHVGRADVSRPSSMASTPDRAAPERGTGWAREIALRPPEGVEHIDRMVEAQTAKERMQSVLEAIDADEKLKRAAAQRKQKD
jgi:hypothetical protein